MLSSQLLTDCETQGLSGAVCKKIAEETATAMGVFEDEVGILRIEDVSYLTFLYPPELSRIGKIPLSDSSSIAAKTASGKHAEVINNFPQTRHVSFFEAVRLRSSPRGNQLRSKGGTIIQMMITVPVLRTDAVVGVVQVCRKGATHEAAGRNFTPTDLQKLTTIAASLAKFFP